MKALKTAVLCGAAFSVLALPLAGCQTATLDTKIQQSLPVICQDGSVLFATFTAASTTMSPDMVRKVDAAYNALATVCTNPAQATAATVLVEAATAYADFALAVKKAK